MSLESDYLIIEIDGSFDGWGALLKSRPHKYSSKQEEKICAYQSGKFKENDNSIADQLSRLLIKV